MYFIENVRVNNLIRMGQENSGSESVLLNVMKTKSMNNKCRCNRDATAQLYNPKVF